MSAILASLGSGIINGVASLGGSLVNAFTSMRNTDKTNKAQMKLAQYQYEKNLEQWHRENEYNSPSAQMDRLQSAGLNPHLIYENGGANTPAARSPQYEAPTLQRYGNIDFGIGDAVASYLNGSYVQRQIENLVEQNENLKSQRSFTDAQTAKALIEGSLLSDDSRVRGELNRYSVEAARLSARNLEEDILSKQSGRDLNEARIQNLKSSTNLNDHQARRVSKEIDKLASDIAVNSMKIRQGDLDYRFDFETYNTRLSLVGQSLSEAFVRLENMKSSGKLTRRQIESVTQDTVNKFRNGGLPGSYSVIHRFLSYLFGSSVTVEEN